MISDRMSVGKMLRDARIAKGWNQKQFRDQLQKIDIKISTTFLSMIENHGKLPAPLNLCYMADLLGLDINEICDRAQSEMRVRYGLRLEEIYSSFSNKQIFEEIKGQEKKQG